MLGSCAIFDIIRSKQNSLTLHSKQDFYNAIGFMFTMYHYRAPRNSSIQHTGFILHVFDNVFVASSIIIERIKKRLNVGFQNIQNIEIFC